MTGITNQFKIGDTVSFANDKGEIIKGTFMHYCSIITFAKVLGSDSFEYERKVTQIKFLSRKEPETPKVIQATLFAPKTKEPLIQNVKPQSFTSEKMQMYDVNQRFSFLESYVRMTAKGFRNSLIITGEGGLGKTYTVEKTLESLGLIPCDGKRTQTTAAVAQGKFAHLYLYLFILARLRWFVVVFPPIRINQKHHTANYATIRTA